MNDVDPEDGLPVGDVGEWVIEKHARLEKYVGITRETRRKYLDLNRPLSQRRGSAYIDLFCGSGRARIRETGVFVDGSPLVAFKTAKDGGVPFSEVHLADVQSEFCTAAAQRIIALGGAAVSYSETAVVAARLVVKRVNPYGLHLAFLDPFNLAGLSFEIIKTLSDLRHIDFLMHVSIQDMQRNSDRYTMEEYEAFDTFAPGWRNAVDINQNLNSVRAAVLAYWQKLLGGLGFLDSRAELIRGNRNQRLYWLALASRHKIANNFWDKIRNTSGQREFDL